MSYDMGFIQSSLSDVKATITSMTEYEKQLRKDIAEAWNTADKNNKDAPEVAQAFADLNWLRDAQKDVKREIKRLSELSKLFKSLTRTHYSNSGPIQKGLIILHKSK